MIADTSASLSASLNPYAGYKESGLPWLGLCVRNQEISTDILAIEREAEGLLSEIVSERQA